MWKYFSMFFSFSLLFILCFFWGRGAHYDDNAHDRIGTRMPKQFSLKQKWKVGKKTKAKTAFVDIQNRTSNNYTSGTVDNSITSQKINPVNAVKKNQDKLSMLSLKLKEHKYVNVSTITWSRVITWHILSIQHIAASRTFIT